MPERTRPTKKQHELLQFLKDFITEHGYSPSYREIMKGCNYTSVATVALHVNNLIKRGHVIKRDKSARSLEVVSGLEDSIEATTERVHELVHEVEKRFQQLEHQMNQELLDEVYVLVGALKILGHTESAQLFASKIRSVTENQ